MKKLSRSHFERSTETLYGKQRISVFRQGKLIKVVVSKNLSPPIPGDTRGTIKEFSASSRLRLLRFIATVDWSQVTNGLFVTLTYPDQVANRTSDERTKDRSRFLRDLEKLLGKKLCGLWRLEWIARKSGELKGCEIPHLHLLLLHETFADHKDVRRLWRNILNVEGPLATDVRKILNGEMAAIYTAKYMSKVPPSSSLDYGAYLNKGGRHYGMIRKALIPFHKPEWISNLTTEQIYVLLREAGNRLPWFNAAIPQTFSFLGPNAIAVSAILDKMSVDAGGHIADNA